MWMRDYPMFFCYVWKLFISFSFDFMFVVNVIVLMDASCGQYDIFGSVCVWGGLLSSSRWIDVCRYTQWSSCFLAVCIPSLCCRDVGSRATSHRSFPVSRGLAWANSNMWVISTLSGCGDWLSEAGRVGQRHVYPGSATHGCNSFLCCLYVRLFCFSCV